MASLTRMLVPCILMLFHHAIQVSAKQVDKTVQGGEDFYLYCERNINSVRPDPWLKDLEPVLIDQLHLMNGANYSVKEATESDSGLYTCGEYSVNLTVQGLRLGYHLPEETHVLEGDHLELTVPIIGLNSSTDRVAWDMDLHKIHADEKGKPSYPVNMHAQNSNLTIVNVTTNNSGIYRMQIKQNNNSTVSLKTATHVIVCEPIQFVKELQVKLSVDQGDSVLLECEASAATPINISWSRSNGTPTLNCTTNCSIVEHGLEIHNASKDSAGEYICTASNFMQEKHGATQLIVRTPPSALQVEVKELWRKGYVNITWQVKDAGGYPVDQFVIHSLAEDRQTGRRTSLILEDKHKTWVQLGPVVVGQVYKFEMWAHNKLGDGEKVRLNFTYSGAGNHTIATAQNEAEAMHLLHEHTNVNSFDNVTTLSRAQQVLISTVMAMFAMMLMGGVICMIFCRIDRTPVGHHRLRQDSETSDVLGLADNDTPRGLHSWSFVNPMFEDHLIGDDNTNSSSHNISGGGDMPPGPVTPYDFLPPPFDHNAVKIPGIVRPGRARQPSSFSW